jgi:hypothetical protein
MQFYNLLLQPTCGQLFSLLTIYIFNTIKRLNLPEVVIENIYLHQLKAVTIYFEVFKLHIHNLSLTVLQWK